MLQSMKTTLAMTAKTKVLVKCRYNDNLTRFLRKRKVRVVCTKAEKTHQQIELKKKRISLKLTGQYSKSSGPNNHVCWTWQNRAGVSAVATVAWQLQIFEEGPTAILDILSISVVLVYYTTNRI